MNVFRFARPFLIAVVSLAAIACGGGDEETPAAVVDRVQGTWKNDALVLDLRVRDRLVDCTSKPSCEWEEAAALDATITSATCGEGRVQGRVSWGDRTSVLFSVGEDVFDGDVAGDVITLHPAGKKQAFSSSWATCMRNALAEGLVAKKSG